MWEIFHHNGLYYPVNYSQSKSYLLYDSKFVSLPPLAEQYAYLYYRTKEEYKDETFKQNFWRSWKLLLPKYCNIKNFNLCNFAHFAKKKINIEKIPSSYKTCNIDGKVYQVLSPMMEPASIFTGRGEHPARGKIKKLILPEDVTLNLSSDAAIPKCPVSGHSWGNIVHNNDAYWLATWKDSMGVQKYVYPNYKYFDKDKFELARDLKKKLPSIRRSIYALLEHEKIKLKQLGTALWLVDKHCLRIGNEKGDDTADTVGACTLRVEHIEFKANNVIILKFPAKDSIPYKKSFVVDQKVYKNLRQFMKNKSKSDQIFDLIDSSMCNRFLHKNLKGLTAKVFRTCHASRKFCNLLSSVSENPKKGYRDANKKVATLCNHTNLGTSRNNYIDPRIVFAFVRRFHLNIHDYYTDTQLQKHQWAQDTEASFRF